MDMDGNMLEQAAAAAGYVDVGYGAPGNGAVGNGGNAGNMLGADNVYTTTDSYNCVATPAIADTKPFDDGGKLQTTNFYELLGSMQQWGHGLALYGSSKHGAVTNVRCHVIC